MGKSTNISWCDATYNPWWGCTKVSPACTNCYAEQMAKRFGTEWGDKAERRRFGAKHWDEPLRWNSAAIRAGRVDSVFCGSMCDWAEDNRALTDRRFRLWSLIRRTKSLRWLLLTKRADRIAQCLPDDWGDGYHNVALGVTAENQEWWNKRVHELLAVRARWRFVSYEPALGPVDAKYWLPDATALAMGRAIDIDVSCPTIDWVICGGESGPQARPMHPDWARSVRDQCVAAGVPFFFKQWGEWSPTKEGIEYEQDRKMRNDFCFLNLDGSSYTDGGSFRPTLSMSRIGKARAGRLLDGREWNETPWEEGHA